MSLKIRYIHQKFQNDAALAICEVFSGQPFSSPTHMIDPGIDVDEKLQIPFYDIDYIGFNNAPIKLDNKAILENIRRVQQENKIRPSDGLEGKYNLTIEMETGVGKTYTYIKTMYELNKRYGWSKFIVVVPSIAIREGVYNAFKSTEDHFIQDYGKKIRYFIYNSAKLNEIDQFANDSSINVMIINSQAFNARGKDARRIHMKLDEFRSRKPVDIIARTNPIIIIDEPQSVEGKATKAGLKKFNPMMTLRYSATHRPDSFYNLVYRLDAIEAFNKRLVKKIAVKGITASGSTGTEGYIYVQSINLSKGNPTATIEFDLRGKTGLRKVTKRVEEGYNLFDNSNGLAQYKEGYIIRLIDGRDSCVEFLNGKKLYAGDVVGSDSEDQLRRIQIRETIISHFEREQQLFSKNIKVLSLFFIDKVANYRQYDEQGHEIIGLYAQMFHEEYDAIRNELLSANKGSEEYIEYLKSISPEQTHAGYFSIDKRSGRIVDSKIDDRRARTSDDTDAFDLIMRDKNRLLERQEPVRFIFSHSALREGWDNPNVFQICTLKQSGSEVRKRQEVGRGLRLSVDQKGFRMDENTLSREEIHNVNVLTVIASESYESFAKTLQKEIAEAVANRPIVVDAKLFSEKLEADVAILVHEGLIEKGYVRGGTLTEKYYEAKEKGKLDLPEEVAAYESEIVGLLDTVFDPQTIKPEDARKSTIEVTLDKEKMNSQAFRKLWSQINSKSFYVVDFNEEELIQKSIAVLNSKLHVPKIYFKVEKGEQIATIESKKQLEDSEAFTRTEAAYEDGVYQRGEIIAQSSVLYDPIRDIVDETGLTRKAVASILHGIQEDIFNQFKNNPEEFIVRASNLINEQKATTIIEHITYDKLSSVHGVDIFTDHGFSKGTLGINAMETERHLYDYLIYDSQVEHDFAKELEAHNQEVEVYVKLPKKFYINTPVGKYNPDWAIAFYKEKVKHIYFVAETKGSLSSLELRDIEKAKIYCARKHFNAISGANVKYDVVDSYEKLWEIVQGE